MEPIYNVIELGTLTFLGVFIACKIFDYDISLIRKVIAAGLFALLYNAPIPFVQHILPPVVMYMALLDERNQRGLVLKVFIFAYLFSAITTLMLYYILHQN